MTSSTPACDTTQKISLLFVCLGNICRSCTAEEVFRQLARREGVDSHFEVDSAGLIDYHEGELPDPRMRQHAARHGYHLTHRSRPVRKEDFDRFDLILAMDETNRERLMKLAPHRAAQLKILPLSSFLAHHPDHFCIPDPYYGGAEGFELVIELLEDACDNLKNNLLHLPQTEGGSPTAAPQR